MPTWAFLAAVVAVSAVGRFLLARRDPVAWIFPDEIAYSELAKAVAQTGSFALRENPGTNGLGIVYPVIAAPGYALFDSVVDAHEAVKAINSFVMSLTAIPVYLIARRVASRGLALTAVVLSLAIPAMSYTGTVMTENAFYPVTAAWMLVLVRALERPTAGRQAVVVLGIAVAYLTRAQAAALVPVLLTAIVILAVLEGRRRFWAELWRYRVTGLLLVTGAVGVGLLQLARGQRVSELLGAYRALEDFSYGIGEVAHWALLHLAELVILLGVFPFAAFLMVVALDLQPSATRERRIFAAAAVPFVSWFLVEVSAFATTPVSQRIEERYLFYVVPFFFVALVSWIGRGAPRPWWALWPAVLFTAALPAALPINSHLNEFAVHDAMSLLPIWRWRDRLFSPVSIDEVVVGAAVAAVVVIALIPRRWAIVLPIALAVYFVAAARPVESLTHRAAVGAWVAGGLPVPNWLDRAIGRDADTSVVWTGSGNHFAFWEGEFFNRTVGAVYALSQPYDAFGQRDARILPSGRVEYLGRPLHLGYALTDIWTELRADLAVTNELTAMQAYRVDGPLVVAQTLQGLHPDGWSGTFAIYRRYGCEGGTVRFTVNTNPTLHTRPFQVRVLRHGAETERLTVRPRPLVKELSVPLESRDGFCEVHLEMPTRPATLVTIGDLRQLGLDFHRADYVPPTPSGR
jgi:hypothetical protein